MKWTKKEICSFVDLTSLNSFDSNESIKSFLSDVLNFEKKEFPVAAVCLFPNFSALAVNELKNSSIKVAVVAGNFPNSQGFISTQLNECELALSAGADEIDIVINLGEFDNGNHQHVANEITAFKGLMPDKILKVILETGYLKTPERIRSASELAIKGGADFIKTSTGKEFPGASLEAVEIMSEVIAAYKTERKVGLKISGGVKTFADALEYFAIVEKHLGIEYMTPEYLRIGASSLVRNLMND